MHSWVDHKSVKRILWRLCLDGRKRTTKRMDLPPAITHTHTHTKASWENIITHGVRGQSHVNNRSWLVLHYSSIFYLFQIGNLRVLCLCLLHLLTGHKFLMSHIYCQYGSSYVYVLHLFSSEVIDFWGARALFVLYGHTGVYAFKCKVKLTHTEWNLAISPITQQIVSVLRHPQDSLYYIKIFDAGWHGAY